LPRRRAGDAHAWRCRPLICCRIRRRRRRHRRSHPRKQTWTAVVANAEFMLNDVQNESMAEQLRERVRFFREIGRDVDFYLVPNPTWLDTTFAAQGKQVQRPCIALVSTDAVWITFMKLRLDRVLKVNLAGMPEAEVLRSGGPIPAFAKPLTDKWTAPYSRYAAGWWEVFYPKA